MAPGPGGIGNSSTRSGTPAVKALQSLLSTILLIGGLLCIQGGKQDKFTVGMSWNLTSYLMPHGQMYNLHSQAAKPALGEKTCYTLIVYWAGLEYGRDLGKCLYYVAMFPAL